MDLKIGQKPLLAWMNLKGCLSFNWDVIVFFSVSYDAMFWLKEKNITDNTLMFLVAAKSQGLGSARPRSWEGTELEWLT